MNPRGQGSKRDLAVALSAAVLLYAAGAWLLHRTWPPALAARPAPEPLQFAFQSDDAGMPGASAWDRDPRALWSPVLFALPSEAGFSPARHKRQRNPSPLLSERAPPTLLLDRSPASPASVVLTERTGAEVARLLAHRWVAIAAPNEPFAQLVPTSTVLNVAWPDGAPEVTGGLPLSIDPPLAQDEKPWEVMAIVQFAETGEPRSVFLDQTTAGRDRNDSLVRALRLLRIAPGRAASHRVALFLQRPLLTAVRPPESVP